MSNFRYAQKPAPRFRISFILIAANILVFLGMKLWPDTYQISRSLPDEYFYLSLNPVLFVQQRFYWTVLTYMFVHGNFTHLLFNMLGLFFFAPPLEEEMGRWEFLGFYLTTGILSGAFSLGVYLLFGMNGALLMGASGAIFAVLLAFAVYYPRARVFFMGFIPMKAPIMVGIFAAIELFQQVFNLRSGVSHLTHLAGLAFGYLYLLIRLKIRPIERIRSAFVDRDRDHFR